MQMNSCFSVTLQQMSSQCVCVRVWDFREPSVDLIGRAESDILPAASQAQWASVPETDARTGVCVSHDWHIKYAVGTKSPWRHSPPALHGFHPYMSPEHSQIGIKSHTGQRATSELSFKHVHTMKLPNLIFGLFTSNAFSQFYSVARPPLGEYGIARLPCSYIALQ